MAEQKEVKTQRPARKGIYKKFNTWLKASADAMKGDQRDYMEDRLTISSFKYKHQTFYIFLLLDGHGGAEVAEYVMQHFERCFAWYVTQHDGFRIRKCIIDTFNHLNSQVAAELETSAGTTASLVLFVERHNQPRTMPKVWVANVGDSSVYGVLSRTNKVQRLTRDHNVELPSEKTRIRNTYSIEDGYVCTDEGHMLAVTRAIGDLDFGAGVTATPSVFRVKVPYDTFILASDGIWDVMNGHAVWKELKAPRQRKAWREAALRVNQLRNERYSQHDNTSIIVVTVDRAKFTHVPTPSTPDHKPGSDTGNS